MEKTSVQTDIPSRPFHPRPFTSRRSNAFRRLQPRVGTRLRQQQRHCSTRHHRRKSPIPLRPGALLIFRNPSDRYLKPLPVHRGMLLISPTLSIPFPQEEDCIRAVAGYPLKSNARFIARAPPQVANHVKVVVLYGPQR